MTTGKTWKNRKVRLCLSVCAVICFFRCQADIGIGNFDYGTFTSGDVDTQFIWQDTYSLGFDKIDSGAATLSLDRFANKEAVKIGVRMGRLTLTGGSADLQIEKPLALDKALLWLDAGTNLVMNGDSSDVQRWLDVREKYPDGQEYPSASSSAGHYPYVKVGSDGMKRIFFGGSMTSGLTMRLEDTGRTEVNELANLRHVFVVTDIESVYGFTLAANSSAAGYSSCFHPGSVDGSMSQCYLSRSEAHASVISGRCYRNGVYIDPYSTTVIGGVQVLEWESAGWYAAIGNFFNDRNIAGRCGGDSICEVVLFTNRLSVVERRQVGEYLLRKWKGATAAKPSVWTASGSEVALGDTCIPLSISGEGCLVAGGSNPIPIKFFPADSFKGSVKVENSDTASFAVAELPYSPSSGERIHASIDNYATVSISRYGDCDSGTAAFTSSNGGEIRVCEFPNDVSNLVVSGSGLILSAPRGGELKSRLQNASSVDAVIGNPSFENVDKHLVSLQRSDEWQTSYGWRFLLPTANSATGAYILDRTTSTWQCPLDAPDGKYALALKAGADCAVDVTIPAEGRYDLTFKTSGRNGSSYDGGVYDIALVKNGSTNIFARVVSYLLPEYVTQRFRTPRVDAGTYELLFIHRSSHDYVAMFDDFRMRLVRDEDTACVIPVPNGDFERCSLAASYGKSVSVNNIAEGWSFVQGGNGTTGYPSVCVGTVGMGGDWFNAGSSRSGNIQMVLWENGGQASSDMFQSLPAGRWRLRCRASRWGRSRLWHGVAPRNVPVVQASVVVDGMKTDLGTVTIADSRLSEMYFPNAIEVGQDAAIFVTVSQTVAEACAIVDDFEFVSSRLEELCINGSFEESGNGWTYVSHKNETETLDKSISERQSLVGAPEHYGTALADGQYALKLVDMGEVKQEIFFPERGLYRLSFWVRARNSVRDDDTYAGNSIVAFLTDSGGTTNEIIRTGVIYSTNFVEKSTCFTVPSSGNYRLHFQGENDGSGVIVNKKGRTTDLNAFVDSVSLTKVADSASVPHIPDNARITMIGDGVLRLDYGGIVTLKRLKVKGRSLSGIVNAGRFPGLVSGPGSVYVPPVGCVISFK